MGCLRQDKVKNFNQTPLSFHTHPLLIETNMIHIHKKYILYITSNSGSIAPSYNLPSWFISPTFPNFTQPHQLHQTTSGAFLFLRAVKMADSFMRFSRSAPLKPAVRLAMSIKVMPSANFLFLNGRWGVGWWWWWHIVGGDDDIGRFWWMVLGGCWWLDPSNNIHLGSYLYTRFFFSWRKKRQWIKVTNRKKWRFDSFLPLVNHCFGMRNNIHQYYPLVF